MSFPAVILAAGYGTLRNKFGRPHSKLFERMGRQNPTPIIVAVVQAVIDAGCVPCVVLSHEYARRVRRVLSWFLPDADIRFAMQAGRRGTGDAVLAAICELDISSKLIVVNGDMPGWHGETLCRFVEAHCDSSFVATAVVPVRSDSPACVHGFARFDRDADGNITRIIENDDLTCVDRKRLRTANPALMLLDAEWCRRYIPTLPWHPSADNRSPERYLTDLVAIAHQEGYRIEEFPVENFREALGVNTLHDLEFLHTITERRQRVARNLVPPEEGGHQWVQAPGRVVCGFRCGAHSEEFESEAPLTDPPGLCPKNPVARENGLKHVKAWCKKPRYPADEVSDSVDAMRQTSA